MEILLNSANDIYTVTLDVTGKTLTISGCNNFPLDVSSLKEIYNTTHAGNIGLPAANQFAWFRSNGLPIFVWGLSSFPAGSDNGDTLNVMLDIPRTQSILSLQQKQASASAGTPGTLMTAEVPSGTINGTNQTFTLANTPIKGAIMLIYTPSGQPTQFLQYGVYFTVSGNTVEIVVPPLTGSTLYANYYH
jgi:hypothetical protein